MGVRRVGHSKAPWLDACRRWRGAISGKWARSGAAELADSVAMASGETRGDLGRVAGVELLKPFKKAAAAIRK